jgi:hypothetical protein
MNYEKNKKCQTNPISGKLKMTLSHYNTRNYENKSVALTIEKQSQTNPISKDRSFYKLRASALSNLD